MKTAYSFLDSPLGRLLLTANDEGLTRIGFPEGKGRVEPHPDWILDAAPFARTAAQLRAYLAGELREFALPLAPQGSAFQLRVWNALGEIPYGATCSYGELARRIGNPNGSRAVGLANGSNPLPIVIPCHRVIGSNGSLTGYGGGLRIKEALLRLERSQTSFSFAQSAAP